jgi:diketogulonate reductase-like aldo/keto reductase
LAPRDARRSVESSLKRLNLDHVDLILIHWPSSRVPLADTLAALHKVRHDGLARHIGVSNFPSAMLREAVAVCNSPIVCNQVEYHPQLRQAKLLSACAELGLALVSYCPLGAGRGLLDEPALKAAAQAHGRTPAQIALRWHVQQEGVAAIPRSSKVENIRDNLDVFDFRLSDNEMRQISALSARNRRICDYAFSPRWDAP